MALSLGFLRVISGSRFLERGLTAVLFCVGVSALLASESEESEALATNSPSVRANNEARIENAVRAMEARLSERERVFIGSIHPASQQAIYAITMTIVGDILVDVCEADQPIVIKKLHRRARECIVNSKRVSRFEELIKGMKYSALPRPPHIPDELAKDINRQILEQWPKSEPTMPMRLVIVDPSVSLPSEEFYLVLEGDMSEVINYISRLYGILRYDGDVLLAGEESEPQSEFPGQPKGSSQPKEPAKEPAKGQPKGSGPK